MVDLFGPTGGSLGLLLRLLIIISLVGILLKGLPADPSVSGHGFCHCFLLMLSLLLLVRVCVLLPWILFGVFHISD